MSLAVDTSIFKVERFDVSAQIQTACSVIGGRMNKGEEGDGA